MPPEPAVLVIRPAGQAGPLMAKLEALGLRTVHQPMLELRALPELSAAARQAVLDLDRYQHLIFVSTNAVQFGLGFIDEYWPQLPVGINWFGVGSATAKQLADRGLAPLSPGVAMDSEGLLAMPELNDVAGQRVLLVKGEGGRQTLKTVLTDRGATVDELICYRRLCPALPPGALAELLQNECVGTILVSSGEGLANMLSLLSDKENTKFRDIGLVVPSSRVAAEARQAGFSDIIIAENASDDAMLEALRNKTGGE